MTTLESFEKQARSLETLGEISPRLISIQKSYEVASVVTSAGRELFDADFGVFIGQAKDDLGGHDLVVCSGIDDKTFTTEVHDLDIGVLVDPPGASMRFRLIRIDDLSSRSLNQTEKLFAQLLPQSSSGSVLIGSVSSAEGKHLALLMFVRAKPNGFDPWMDSVLTTLSVQTAIAIENANLSQRLGHEREASAHSEALSEMLSAIVESSDDAIIGRDLNGHITSWNSGAERILGYSAREILGKPIATIFPKEQVNDESAIMSRVRAGKHIDHYETVRVHKDGTLVDMSLSVSPIRDIHGEIVGASKIMREISDRKRRDRELQEALSALADSKAELEFRVSERTASLRVAVEQMEEFSYTVSHDLRAPLRAITSYGQALMEDFGDLLRTQPEAVHYLERISHNCARLDRMIVDVLQYTHVARVEVKLQPVDLDSLVAEVIEQNPAIQAPNAMITVERLGKVMGHETSVSQILSNLLGNAVKFVAPGVVPAVHVRSERLDGMVRIWFEDNGIGVKPEYQHRLFKMFERIDPSLDYEGSGVGLAIVRKAAQRMGGQAGVVSDGKTGSQFWVELKSAADDQEGDHQERAHREGKVG